MSETKEDLRAWMRFGQPLEAVLGDFQRVFDAWRPWASMGSSWAACTSGTKSTSIIPSSIPTH